MLTTGSGFGIIGVMKYHISFFWGLICSFTALADREVTNLSVAVADDGSATATTEFTAGAEGDAHVLYYVWSNDGVDKGDDLTAWPHVLRVNRVADDATSMTFQLPVAAFVTPQYTARAVLATSEQPYDYLVSSLYASKTQACYFDTGYYPAGGKTCVTMECQLAASGTDAKQYYAFGANVTFSFCAYINGNGYWAFSCNNGGGSWKHPSTLAASKTDRVRVTLDASVSPSDFTVETSDGITRLTSSETHTRTATSSLYLFGRNNKAAGDNDKDFAATFYSCVITDGDVRVRDYRPAVSNGVCGLYDRVNGTFAPSSGSTAFSTPGTNVSYFVAEGDRAVAVSPVWKQQTYDFALAVPYVEPHALITASGGSKSGAAPLTLTGKNDFGGTFTVTEGTLVADFGQGLALTDKLVLDGGTYCPLTSEIFTNRIGETGAPVSISVPAAAPIAGFSAYGHPLTVRLANDPDEPLVFGSEAFALNKLMLNDAYANDTLTFENDIQAGEDGGEIRTDGAVAVVTGDIAGDGMFRLTGDGTLVLKGTNTFAGRMYAIGGGNAVIADTELNCNGLTVSNTAHLVVSNSIVSYGNSSFQTFGGSRTTFVGGKISGEGTWYPGNRVEKEAVTVLDGVIADFNEVTSGYYNNKNFYGRSRIVITNDAEVSMEKLSGRHGSIHQYGGVVKVTGKTTGDFRIGSQSNGRFEYCIYGGSLLQTGIGTDRGFHVGMHENFTPEAYLRLYGGEAVMSQPIGYLGRYANNVGNVYAHGGLFKMKHASGRLFVGYLGSGRLSVADGGVVDIPTEIGVLPKSATVGRKGYVDLLTNGTVTAQRIYSTCTNDTAELTFDGGAFVAKSGARTPLISGFTQAYVGVGGGTVDTAGQDLTVEQNFAARAGQTWTVGDGGDELLAAPAFTKKGEGALTLTGTNTYACATCVSNGTLIAACEGALPETTTLRLGPGGTIDLGGESHTVANLIGAGTVANGALTVTGTVYPGHGGGDADGHVRCDAGGEEDRVHGCGGRHVRSSEGGRSARSDRSGDNGRQSRSRETRAAACGSAIDYRRSDMLAVGKVCAHGERRSSASRA